MWSRNYTLTTDIDSQALWDVHSDVGGWAQWNNGIE